MMADFSDIDVDLVSYLCLLDQTVSCNHAAAASDQTRSSATFSERSVALNRPDAANIVVLLSVEVGA